MKLEIIEPSRFRMYIIYLCLNLFYSAITLLLFQQFLSTDSLQTNISDIFLENNAVSVALVLYILGSPYFYTSRIFYQTNIIFNFEQSKIGCQSCTYSLVKMTMGNKHCIAKDDLDIDKTLKRKLTDKIRGVYHIFDKEGLCFIIHKYYFYPEDFTRIKGEFLKIYEVNVF